jgi:ABC-type sugar transport system permease subunit
MSGAWTQKAAGYLRQVWPLIPAAAYLMVFLVIVLVYLLGLSLSWPVGNGASIAFPSLMTLKAVFARHEFIEALVNTTLFMCAGTPLELIAGIFLALLLYRNFYARSLVRSIFLIPLAVPALVTAILLFILFDFPGGHINHLLMGKYAIFPPVMHEAINWRGEKILALGISLLGKIWRDMPISMLIILAGLNAIDTELFDAAKTMGAGFRTRLFSVILPLLIPACATVILLRSIEMWKEFIFPFVLAGKYSLLGTLIESLYNNWGASREAAAVALIMVACIVATLLAVLFLMDIVRRRFLEGGRRERCS